MLAGLIDSALVFGKLKLKPGGECGVARPIYPGKRLKLRQRFLPVLLFGSICFAPVLRLFLRYGNLENFRPLETELPLAESDEVLKKLTNCADNRKRSCGIASLEELDAQHILGEILHQRGV